VEIVCSFEQIAEWHHTPTEEAPTKSGRYDSSNLPEKGLGHDKWALVANIVLEKPLSGYLDDGMTEKEVVEACIRHLNKPPTKRARKPKYGKLRCRFFNVLGNSKISMSLITTERNSKYFWGRGAKKSSTRKTIKRGRPRKVK